MKVELGVLTPLVQLQNSNEKNSSDHSEAPSVAQKVCLLSAEMKPATKAQFLW